VPSFLYFLLLVFFLNIVFLLLLHFLLVFRVVLKFFDFFYYLKIENGTHMRLGDEDETRRAKRRENKSVAHR